MVDVVNNKIKTVKKHNENIQAAESCCEDPCIDVRDGNNVCLSCGMIVGRDFRNEERRIYNQADTNIKRTEDKWFDAGARTLISKERRDSRGKHITAESAATFSRLAKIQRSLISGVEVNYSVARPQLKLICSKMAIPKHARGEAWNIYKEAVKKGLIRGRSIAGFIAASTFVAIRKHKIPKSLEEVTDASPAKKRVIIKCLSVLRRELNLQYSPINPEQLIYKFGSELQLPLDIQITALELLSKAFENGLNKIGTDPRGLAAAVLYITAIKCNHRITQVHVCSVTKISEVTLRTRKKDLEKALGGSSVIRGKLVII